ncbi:MAG: hypothetical protein PUC29_08295 [Clostridia bacterium]|nr:hypothetical protein [Clostridia bacterium]
MTLREKIEKLLSEIEELNTSPADDKRLPQNTFYLNENDILCCEREVGESRYPYDADGLVVWAHSSGYIDACESTFSIFKTAHYAEDPSLGFFAGIPLDNGEFYPVSVLGSSRQLFEPLPVRRYVVYSFRCAYYIADTDNVTFAVRLHVSADKHIHFAFTAINKTGETVPFYLASSVEAILRFQETEDFWCRMSKYGKRYPDGSAMLRSDADHCLVINKAAFGGEICGEYCTMGKSDFLGPRGRQLTNAEALRSGVLKKQVKSANTTDIPMAAEIIHYELPAGEMLRREYDLSYYHSFAEAEKAVGAPIDVEEIDNALICAEKAEISRFETVKVSFSDWSGNVNAKVLNKFIRNVQKQVSFCALGKNYAGPHIGIRDVMQQLESSLIWQPKESREKIITALNFIMENGRPPRQFSLPATPDMIPDMDLRMYIDQGVWIISTVHTYLSYTGDWSILSEECSYYVPSEDNTYIVRKSEIRDTVLDHLLKIMDYLASNLDGETGCLHALYGDWNDAIDGLGKTKDPGKAYGTGVTVMASLQFYRNCFEMADILTHLGTHLDKLPLYEKYRNGIESGLMKYGIDKNNKGERRIIHGWGDKMSYRLGSYNDPDGKARRSTTSNSFWVLSGMIERDVSLKESILDNFNAVKSKYGLMTFDEPFTPDMRDVAGRISGITPGTYENAAAYVHASMFAIMALFSLGESEFAWEELERSTVISHENCTMTPFAMPNSYCRTDVYEIDGDSMGDWYTGSGTVLIKALIKYGFGISPDLDGLTVQTPAVMPCKEAKLSIVIKGHPVTVIYKNSGKGKRSFTVDGTPADGKYCSLMKTEKLFIENEKIHDGMIISVED